MKKLSNWKIADIVEKEGLEAAILVKVGYEEIEDQELAKLWKDADNMFSKLASTQVKIVKILKGAERR